ncbi:MAG: DUF815 domain-containing protein [Firmicutes bacterium]|nr:DUF815 domain-containing protein [Bacillota bacterium]MDY5857004.1 DUF815 domain-containing protein [Anaerovoracaceae bacterium]
MNETSLNELYHRLNALTVFRSIAEEPVIRGLKDFLYAAEHQDLDARIDCYSAFCRAVYEEGGNLSQAVCRIVLEDENFYIVGRARGQKMSDAVEEALEKELSLLQDVSQLAPSRLQEAIAYGSFLPEWTLSEVDIRAAYRQQIEKIGSTGYGIFARYHGFTVKDGQLVPIRSMDTQTLDTLYGYERERNLVLENTRALVEGQSACNVLLYGDAGTGKSSTIKAVARHFFDQGLRIVEFKKNQLADILPIMESLSEIPLKFIFYIDDLSFQADDDTFCDLKGILEGSAASYAGNIAIYATSNRRHLVKESMSDRVGDQLHVNDTLQETMSLAARFGLTITFSKPEKDLYLDIVRSLAPSYGIDLPDEELCRRAEAFAIRQNGRSPRTAKQFLQLTKIGL